MAGAPIGNQNGAKQNKLFGDVLKRAIAQDDGARLRQVAEKLLTLASEGEAWAVKELIDRTDGKAHQSISGPDGASIPLSIGVTYAKPPEG